MRIAMWSGPRNISTAMMYAFGNRPDFAVIDEPFYAAYLAQSGKDHPMREEILASQSDDPETVVAALTGPIPGNAAHFYQKHMAQHMLPGIPRDWLGQMENVFLIRHPARVVASFSEKYENPGLDDLGYRQQADLFEHLVRIGQQPIVMDSTDIRANPEAMLRALCAKLSLDWDRAMLSWPKGGHERDGVWASHWYGAVHQSTGFAGPEGPVPELRGAAAQLADAAMPYYQQLWSARLRA